MDNAETLLLVFAYLLAFFMAYTSKAIELSNAYGSYYQFISLTPRTFLYCGTYGLIGAGGYALYKANIRPDLVNASEIGVKSEFWVVILSAMLIGWSAKGLSDTPILPSKEVEGQSSPRDGFRLSIIISFLFRDNSEQYDIIITRKQKVFFKRCHDEFAANKNKADFCMAVYEFLNLHPKYGASPDPAGVAKFNAIMEEVGSQPDLESAMRYVYRNLGYKVFKTVIA